MYIRALIIHTMLILNSATLFASSSLASDQAIHAHQCKKLVESLEILQKEYQKLLAGQMELHEQYVCQGTQLEEEQKKNQLLTEEIAALKQKITKLKEEITRLSQ